MTEARPMIPAYPALSRDYDAEFRADADYRQGMPDLQNGPASLIVGARAPIWTDVDQLMRELTASARAMRQLAEYLERHPEALITGKSQ